MEDFWGVRCVCFEEGRVCVQDVWGCPLLGLTVALLQMITRSQSQIGEGFAGHVETPMDL